MPLDRYRDKRDFAKTPEPAGDRESGSSSAPIFVVQKHAASRLHYDVRLELDGVLKSWAVPKGPSLDTRDRRLAVHVEDHPLEYGSFEGTIPKGEYGGGTVMVWDRGTYEPVGDFHAAYAEGRLKFVLHGTKLAGHFTLVRMKPREGDHAENWLLIKERDEFVRSHDEYDVVEARPESAASGRDMEQIAAGDQAASDISPHESHARRLEQHHGDIPMQLARLSERAPSGEEWIHEVKYDGYRVRASIRDGATRMLTRTGQDWTDRFEAIAREAARLPVSSALLDGEVVVLDSDGRPDFGSLQQALSSSHDDKLSYMVFDLIEMDGWDLRDVPLAERKALLRALLETVADPGPLRYAEHVTGGGEAFHVAACDLSLEGSVSKRGDRPYQAGRSGDWRKVKCLMRQEFVIGGYTEPGGSRRGFGALLLGVYDDGILRYTGRVGTGFTEAELTRLSERLESIEVDESPFEPPPRMPGKVLHWVRPVLVAEVRFQEWTAEGMLRHPSYLGLRGDKPAEQVVRETTYDSDGGEPERGADSPGASADPSPAARQADRTSVAGVTLTNPDKVLFVSGGTSDEGVAKLDLARYYERVADRALTHVANRPLTIVRCPHGRSDDCFYQKHPEAKGLPKAIRTLEIPERDGAGTYMYVDDAAGLVSLAQMGVLEIHAWNSTIDDVESPDRIVFDLDPGPGIEWRTIAQAALLTRDALEALGLTGFLKGTGGKGLHVVVPIERGRTYSQVRSLARAFVERIAQHDPEGFTAKMAKSARTGRIFLDYLRNAHGATAVVPFSTRARPGAPVALPLEWAALEATQPPRSDIAFALQESERPDPWHDYERHRHALTPAHFAALGVPFQEQAGW